MTKSKFPPMPSSVKVDQLHAIWYEIDKINERLNNSIEDLRQALEQEPQPDKCPGCGTPLAVGDLLQYVCNKCALDIKGRVMDALAQEKARDEPTPNEVRAPAAIPHEVWELIDLSAKTAHTKGGWVFVARAQERARAACEKLRGKLLDRYVEGVCDGIDWTRKELTDEQSEKELNKAYAEGACTERLLAKQKEVIPPEFVRLMDALEPWMIAAGWKLPGMPGAKLAQNVKTAYQAAKKVRDNMAVGMGDSLEVNEKFKQRFEEIQTMTPTAQQTDGGGGEPTAKIKPEVTTNASEPRTGGAR